MSDKNDWTGDPAGLAQDLRRRAEQKAMEMAAEHVPSATVEEAGRLLHELCVHQIELEMQNEELRRAQLALDASRARYFDLYDLAPVGYVTLSEDGLIREANLRACTMLGIPRGTLVRQPVTRFIVSDDQDIYYFHRKRLFETGARQSCELRMKQPEGALLVFWARLEAVLAKDGENGAPVCRVAMSDITEHKRLQSQLALADRLSSVGLLAASIGHEVNNPLTYVLFNLETLAEDLPALARRLAHVGSQMPWGGGEAESVGHATQTRIDLEEMIDSARSALDGARRIGDLVKSMQALLHVDEGLIESVSLNGALEAAVTMTAKEISARARLVKHLGQVPRVSANHGQMCRVFLNLLVNAAHSIEEGQVDDNEISVRTWHEGGHVLAEIRDTGSGISAENLDKVFDPFFSTKPAGFGTGLGLSICMRIVTALGGVLTVKSKVDGGSTFSVRLPAQVGVEDSASIPAVDGETAAEGANLRGRVLVIDDEPLVRRALQRMLCAHEVVVAASGSEGRTILAEDSEFDVVLCDLMMPGLSGMDLFSWLQQASPAVAERVVFITGGAFTPKAQEFLATVDSPVLGKPFDGASLRSKVAGLIQRARSRGYLA